MSGPKLFASNAFHTPVGSLVAKATDSSLPKENWSLIYLVTDYIKVNPSCAKDSVKAIKKRLTKNQNFLQLNITLSLLDACIKNCDIKFQELALSEKFLLNTLLKIIETPNHPDPLLIRKVLGLVQDWAFSFQGKANLKDIVEIYNQLKTQGCVFPLAKYPSVPNQTHTRQSSVGSTQSQRVLPQLTPLQLGKLKKDLSLVNSNVRVLSEFLIELNPLSCTDSSYFLVKEISKTCRSMHDRIYKLFGKFYHDDFNASMLSTVGDLNNVLLRFDRFEKMRINRNETLSLKTPSIHSDTESFESPAKMPLEPHYERCSLTSLYAQCSNDSATSSPAKNVGSCVYSLASDVEDINLSDTIPPSVPPALPPYPLVSEQTSSYEETKEIPQSSSDELSLDELIKSLQDPYTLPKKTKRTNGVPARDLTLGTHM